MGIYNLPTIRQMKQGYGDLVARVVALEAKAGVSGAAKPQPASQPAPQPRREAVEDASQARKAVSDGKGGGGKGGG